MDWKEVGKKNRKKQRKRGKKGEKEKMEEGRKKQMGRISKEGGNKGEIR